MLTQTQIERWLQADLGHHDVTNDLPGDTTGRLVAGASGVAAGLEAAARVFEYLDCTTTRETAAGDAVESGETVLRASGPTRAVLRGERVASNVVSHASGVATRTHRAVTAATAAAPAVRVAATRKTTPGLRGLEKRAVAAAGGDTHRLDLSQAVIVKDNHIAELGLETATRRLRDRVSFVTTVEVEVEQPADAPRAAAAGADAVLLDNMSPAETERAVSLVADHETPPTLEASGGITLETVADYAATGVDVVSMGSLTHSAPALEYSFRTGAAD